ncbi:leucyl aminopeptidase family protein [Allokutzneria oryzae]|uniref:Probable cytosol aminopeptidase n=1 Tax=Allokutzneria oryzae TaxID=1378989 RepID=A0ABV6A956_9PSEU
MPNTLTRCAELTTTTTPLTELDVDVVVVTAGLDDDGALVLAEDARAIDAATGGALRATLQRTDYRAAWASQRFVNLPGTTFGAVLVVGVGREAREPGELRITLRERRHALAAGVAGLTGGRVAVRVGADWDPLLAETVALATYRFDRYAEKPRPARLVLSCARQPDADALAELDSRLRSVCFARDWVNLPGGAKRPAASAELLLAEGAQAGVEVHVYSTEDLVAAGAGGIVGVGQGSAEPARIVRLTAYGDDSPPPLVLVGKGLTYDAGGINLKTAWLEHMKLDMGGAAACVGAVLHAGRRPRRRTVQAWIALAENITSATSYLTGDVLRMHNGTSVEVANTDAEGRLALADAMSLADAGGAAAVLTVATLTGSAIASLGPRTAAINSADDDLTRAVLDAAAAAGESMWRMPHLPYFAESLRSKVADVANLGMAQGQSMVAAEFLRRFAPVGAPYLHLDLAGPAFNMGEPYDGVPSGGTGYGVRSLIELADRL